MSHRPITIRRRLKRRGYALMIVFIFVVLFLGLLGIAWRQVASALRIERAVEIRKRCDEGSIRVLALAMQVLETRLCWDTANGVAKIRLADDDYRAPTDPAFSCWKRFNASLDGSNPEWRYYLITFTPTPPADGKQWEVTVAASTETGVLGKTELPGSPP
jgi:hypothetical protein